MRRGLLLIILFLLGSGIVAGSLVLKRSQTSSIPDMLGFVRPTPTPTPMPFAEMTIPYLRGRAYVSSLGPLQKLAENALYTSYRTSYVSDGLTIYGLLTVPKDAEPKHPAIVFVHGYIPPTLYKTNEKYVDHVDYLARNGFVVFKIDLRGHDESQGEAGGAYYSSDYVIDVLNARAALAASVLTRGESSIGLWGHSMAGNVLLRAFAARPEISAVVIWAGAGYTYTDLLTYRISDQSYRPPATTTMRQMRRQQLRDTHGEFDANHPFWRQVAVTDYLKDLKGALEVHHAVDDDVVSVEYSRNLMTFLDATSVPHALFEYTYGGHNITGASFNSAMERTVVFFKRYLGMY